MFEIYRWLSVEKRWLLIKTITRDDCKWDSPQRANRKVVQTYTPLDYESSIPSFDTSWCELNNDLIVFSIMGRASEEHLNFHLTSVHGVIGACT